jgi:FdhE protein
MNAARQSWLAAHPWLAPIARFDAVVEEAVVRVEPPRVEPPRWDAWVEAHGAAVPLLRFGPAGLRFTSPAAYVLGHAVQRAAETLAPGPMANALAEIRDDRGSDPERLGRAIEWAVGGAPPGDETAHPGLLRLFAWKSASHVLAAVLGTPAAVQARGRWTHGSCPTCGSFSALAHLRPGEGARTRFLACACCGTRWRHARIGCPFCAGVDPECLGVLAVADDDRLRIGTCDRCKGYVKTYAGEGDAELFLNDWSTFHLDLLAMKRGFRRFGASLYELPEERGMAA